MRYALVTTLCLLALAVGTAQATAAGDRSKHTPTTLWNAFPLNPQRSPTHRAAADRIASRRPIPAREEKSWVVILVLATLIVIGVTFSLRPQLAPTLAIAARRKLWHWRF